MNFFAPPPVYKASHLAAVPAEFHSVRKTLRVSPKSGKTQTIFIEGITTDPQGNLFVVDIPNGQVLCFNLATKDFKVVKRWEGEPNGLCVRADGKLVIADHLEGVLLLDPQDGTLTTLLGRRNLERFKGPNDLIVDSKDNVYFTDQGQTGLSDPTGVVYRLSPHGKLDALISNCPSPNGLVLSPDEKVLYVAMTRDNSVWRCPLHRDGSTTKVCRFFQSFGTSGPDGLTVDAEGNLFVCHPSLGCIFVVDNEGRPLARIIPPEGFSAARVTNCIFGSTESDRNKLYFVGSDKGDIFEIDWHCSGGTPIRQTSR